MSENTVNGPNAGIPSGAVSLYGADSSEEFPVLKAFQQYIDAEQAKARKRLVSMGIFFGLLTLAVIAVFVTLLMHATERNQALNDRMLELVIKERDRQPTVVQAPQDNSAVMAMTAKIEELQRNITEDRHKAEKAEIERKANSEQEKLRIKAAEEATKVAQQAAEDAKTEMNKLRLEAEQTRMKAEQARLKAQADLEKAKSELERAHRDTLLAQQAAAEAKEKAAAKAKSAAEQAKTPSASELEVQKLNALLALEKQKSANEAAKRKEAELEAYRREHYPELYAKPATAVVPAETQSVQTVPSKKPLLSQKEIDSDEPLSYALSESDRTAISKPKKSPTPVSIKGSSVDWEIPQ